MKKSIKYLSVLILLFVSGNSFAMKDHPYKGNGNAGNGLTGKANCAPPNNSLRLQFNDVSALLNTHGTLFFDKTGTPTGEYEVPKGSKIKAIYAGSLWMGGKTVTGQLKLAAAKFADGFDFWTGPLSVTTGSGTYDPNNPVGDDAVRDFGEATIDPDQCAKYDKFFTIRKAEVVAFAFWWECNNLAQVPQGCDDLEEISPEVLNRIINWPAHPYDQGLGQDFYLAPFYDRGEDDNSVKNGIYNPIEDGDYPWYDDIRGRDDVVCGSDRRITLFGDETHWWIFNDKGNIHTESNGDPIGMEIRAQAFAFATNDEVNRMTFYNYEMINRGTQTLKDTYFAQYVDCELGGPLDDYVGCDVSRGLGYCYNGDNYDEPAKGALGYGANPPAIGIDFFEGPYQDADGKDNLGPHYDTVNGVVTFVEPTVSEALADSGIVYGGIGTGYSDGIIDNERFGMRRFIYYTNGDNQTMSDPTTAAQYYNYMDGKWRFGADIVFGGTGFPGSSGSTTVKTDYAFPADSDPKMWATKGASVSVDQNWSEVTNNNPVGDRRFVQVAGPFTLRPGAINNITVGIVFARSSEGDIFASVRALKRADTKAQALFDNCFKILDPPHAPKLTIQELKNELVLMIDNPANSNNPNEDYIEEDKINIVDPIPAPGENAVIYDKYYRFEGYQIFQMKDASSSVADINNSEKARLVAQCDIKNGISRLVNFEYDEELGFSIPTEKVKGSDTGLKHTFSVKEDFFSMGERTLVNHKKYFYIAVAYAYNQYKEYNPEDPTLLDGQKTPYIVSRINADGSSISAKEAIPHDPASENGGTIQRIAYGSSPRITRIDGKGNGNRSLEFTAETLDEVLKTGFAREATYEYGAGPINVKVVDPLNLANGYFECTFDYQETFTDYSINYQGADSAKWTVRRYDKKDGNLLGTVTSDRSIKSQNEQIIPEWGISVEIHQKEYFDPLKETTTVVSPSTEYKRITNPITSSITFSDSSNVWLTGISDSDDFNPMNWILSGIYDPGTATGTVLASDYNNEQHYKDESDKDPQQYYERLLSGTIAPHCVVGYRNAFSPLVYPAVTGTGNNGLSSNNVSSIRSRSSISRVPSIDIVVTSDKSKWTKCAVIELGRDSDLNIGAAKAGGLRKSPSLDINGNPIAGETGMSYFPGYAVDLESGMRLHMAFGENSFLAGDNGADMIWNPSSRIYDNMGNPIMGGQQPVYVFGYNINGNGCPYYDGVNNWVYDQFKEGTTKSYTDAYMSLSWVCNALGVAGSKYMSSDVKLSVRINKEYQELTATGLNNSKPKYSWSMDDIYAITNSKERLAETLSNINVVPNPYYAFSSYESDRLDNRVKITNLPYICDVKIYNVSGKLIRSYKKDSPVTYLDWDLKNGKGIPVASGVYLIHVDVPGVGEVILKFFGGVRQVDLQSI